jgi:predicted acyl esterase
MVATRDGVELTTDVHLPDGGIAHSAMIVRTCYDKSSRYTALPFEAEYYRTRGFVFVAQDVRGKLLGRQDAPLRLRCRRRLCHGRAHQPWSNARAGVTGQPYYDFTTWAAMSSGHPAYRTALIDGIRRSHNTLTRNEPRPLRQPQYF